MAGVPLNIAKSEEARKLAESLIPKRDNPNYQPGVLSALEMARLADEFINPENYTVDNAQAVAQALYKPFSVAERMTPGERLENNPEAVNDTMDAATIVAGGASLVPTKAATGVGSFGKLRMPTKRKFRPADNYESHGFGTVFDDAGDLHIRNSLNKTDPNYGDNSYEISLESMFNTEKPMSSGIQRVWKNPLEGAKRLGAVESSVTDLIYRLQPSELRWTAAYPELEPLYEKFAARLAKKHGGEVESNGGRYHDPDDQDYDYDPDLELKVLFPNAERYKSPQEIAEALELKNKAQLPLRQHEPSLNWDQFKTGADFPNEPTIPVTKLSSSAHYNEPFDYRKAQYGVPGTNQVLNPEQALDWIKANHPEMLELYPGIQSSIHGIDPHAYNYAYKNPYLYANRSPKAMALTLYHGTEKNNPIKKFRDVMPVQNYYSRKGLYELSPHFAASKSTAKDAIAKQRDSLLRKSGLNYAGGKGNLMTVNAKFKNTLKLEDMSAWRARGIAEQLDPNWSNNPALRHLPDSFWEKIKKVSDKKAINMIRKALIDAGYDSIKYRNMYEGPGTDWSYIPLKRGTVRDAKTGDILFANKAKGAGLVAAIQLKDGTVLKGKPGQVHGDIDIKDPNKYSNDGFVTPEGKYLTREEAMSWVRKNEPKIGTNYPGWNQLEAFTYNADRGIRTGRGGRILNDDE